MLLSSVFYPLPENSGSYLSYSLPKDLGRGWGGFHNTPLTQRAATCFVTDTSACSGNEFGGNNADDDGHGAPGGPGGDDYDLDNEERCRQEGYTQTSCPDSQEGSNFCPYDSTYFEKCVSTCPSNYVTCEVPYYGVGEACDGKYASCEKDTERACQELNPGYVDECGTGQQLSDDRCSYDNTYGTCCNTCAGYDNTTIPEGYVITRLSPIRVTVLWIVAAWAVRPAQRPASRGQRPCMTIVRPVPTWENTRPARAAPYASMRNVRVCGMPPAVRRIVRIIVTSAADSS